MLIIADQFAFANTNRESSTRLKAFNYLLVSIKFRAETGREGLVDIDRFGSQLSDHMPN